MCKRYNKGKSSVPIESTYKRQTILESHKICRVII